MADNLWKLRQRKGLSVQQLAARTGIPARVIEEYERGTPLRQADLARLAKALYVEPDAIKLRSDPQPAAAAPQPAAAAPQPAAAAPQPAAAAPQPPAGTPSPAAAPAAATGPEEPPAAQAPPREPGARKPREPRQPKPTPPPGPARPGQIAQLLVIAGKLELSRAALEQELGKPVEALTFPEARRWLGELVKRMQESAKPPSPIDRHRAHLPEGVDSFEMDYLAGAQADGSILDFTLFNGEHAAGRVVGFSPYFITIQPAEGGDELTLQKLAIAWYTRRRP